jgi:hypothetical protein
MNTPNSFKNWFKTMVENSITDIDFTNFALKDFYYGDSSRFIQATRSEIDYPCLILEVPTYFLPQNFKSNPVKKLRSAFSIVIGCTLDDEDAQDNAQNFAESAGAIVLEKMQAYMKPLGAYFQGDVILEPVMSLIVDNNYGYRFEFYIENIYNPQMSPCR